MATRAAVLVAGLLVTLESHGRELFEYAQSIRALGMGNAYTAVVNDGDSLFYNPAGLGRSTGVNLTLVNLKLGLNGEEAHNTVQKVSSSSAEGIERFSELYGEKLWLGLGGRSTLTIPHFGLGVYSSGFADIELKDPILPYFDINYLNDDGLVVGGAFTIGPKSYFGINAKRVNRSGASQAFGVSSFINGDTEQIVTSLNKKGTGYGVDLGFSWEVPAGFRPVISAVWKDVGTTTFVSAPGSERPPRIQDEQILGIAAGFDTTFLGLTTAIDFKHLNSSQENIGKKIHAGLEVDLPFIDIRGGFSQGYHSLGASIDLFLLQLDMAYYGVELGEYAGQDEGRRYQIALTMDLGFDANFNFVDFNNSKGRRLKRRR